MSRLRPLIAAIAIAAGALAFNAAPAAATSKNVFSTSFAGSGGDALTNPTSVAVDQQTHDVYVTDSPINEQQTVTLNGASTYSLTFRGQTTAPIAPTAQDRDVQDALEGISAIGQGQNNVRVNGGPGGPYTVEFLRVLGGAPQPQITATPTTVTVTTTRPASSVADVEKFSPSGQFILMFGQGVDQTTGGNVCPVNPGDTCQAGTPGTTPGAFTTPQYLAVDNSGVAGRQGDVYVGDYVTGEGSGDVQKFDPSGNLIAAWGNGGLLDGTNDTNGNTFAGDTNGFGLAGVAVDSAGKLFVFSSRRFFEFAQDGSFIADFQSNNVNRPDSLSLAVDGADNIYAGSGTPTTPSVLVEKIAPGGGYLGDVITGEVTDLGIDPATHDLYLTSGGEVEHFTAFCVSIVPCASPIDSFGSGHLSNPQGVAIDDGSNTVYVADTGNSRVSVFTAVPYLPDASASAKADTTTSESLSGSVDPAGAGPVTGCHFEYGTDTTYSLGPVPCSPAASAGSPFTTATPVTAEATGLTYGTTYHFRLVADNANGTASSFDQTFESLPLPPALSAESVSAVHADTALVHAQINPNGGDATYHTAYRVEYVDDATFQEDSGSGDGFQHAARAPVPDADAGSARTLQSVTTLLSGLTPGTTYHYRVIATNANTTTTGPTRTFTTLPFTSLINDTCPNAHVRQQTGAALLLDCRAYELVSAANTGGYDVESSLIGGQTPFGSYPQADSRVLYGIHNGAIPGTGNPTNHGVDPYVATRDPNTGWSTSYVGIPANNPYAGAPFASTLAEASSSLGTFAFGGDNICSPCFADGKTGNPIHMPDGSLVQGMAGSLDPGKTAKPEGYIGKHFSADGSHFVFGSTSQFEPDGNTGGANLTIYDRNLKTGLTHVVSKTTGGATMTGAGIGELDISSNGSRIVVGQLISTDPQGNNYYHLYMNVGDSAQTIDLTPGTTTGALYDGMSADGTKVYFTTADKLTGDDTDTSADIYRADVTDSAATLTRVSIDPSAAPGGIGDTNSCNPVADSAHIHWNAVGSAANCDAVAIGGGGGVASGDGSIYFLSPELLDGSNGTQDQPNLYLARPGSAPHFIATLESVLTGPQPPILRHTFDHNFGSFTDASGLAVEHSSGDVYVMDAATNTVQKFDSSGNLVTSFGDTTPSPDGHLAGTATPAKSFSEFAPINLPAQLAVDQSSGDLYVPDLFNGVLDKFDSSGNYIPSFQVSVTFPSGVAVDPANGDVYVSSFFGSVSVFDSSGNPVSSFPVSGNPTGVAVDAGGTVYVTNGSETDVYDASGNFVRKLDPNASQSVAVDPSNGDVYVDEGPQIVQFDSAGNQLRVTGSGDLSGSVGLAVDPRGNLYASNSAGADVAVFPPSLAPSPLIDNPAVLHAVDAAGARNTADFQVTPSGNDAAFPSAQSLTGSDPAGHSEIYRYDAPTDHLDCVSCTTTGVPSTADATLASNGLSLTDDGRVFFSTADQLAASDTDNRKDAYEWEPQGTGNCQASSPTFGKASGACLALISAGTSPFDSGLLGASADGTDAYFFTRDSLAPQDKNGATMKIYDARAGGGFAFVPSSVPCQASDECHGAGSTAPGPVPVGSIAGTPAQFQPPPKRCKKGRVKRHGRCVVQHHHKRRHHKRANANRGGAK